MDKLRRDDVTADFFGPDNEVTSAPPGRVAIARDNARLFVGNVINNHAAPPRQDTFDIDSERSSLMTTSGLDPITLTVKVFEAATPVASALRSCQKQAARFKIGALSIASLHTECSAIRTTLLQIKSLLSRDGRKPLTIESGRIILEDYYGVLEFSWLLFNVILKHLRSLGLTQLEGMSKFDFTASMEKLWEYREMGEIIQVLGRQARAVDLFHVAFQSETEHEISTVMKSPEARQVIASISDDTISLHESFCTAPEGAYPPETASVTSGREFGFDQILKSTALYRRASMLAGQGLTFQHQRLFHNANTGEAGPSHAASTVDPRVPSVVPLSIPPGILPTPQDKGKLPEGGQMISDDDPLSAFLRDRRLSVGSDSSANTVKAAPSSPRAKRVEPVSVREGSTKADSLVEPSPWQTFDTIIPDNDSIDLYKADKRRPTLFEVLSRRTTKPYSLFEFYIYMRDVQHALDYLDFWLDVAQHMSLCRHYLRELRRSVLVDELELVDSSNHETIQSSDDDGKSRAGSKAASESNPVVARQDIRASAEKILYMFLLPGAEREIVLPGYITQDVTSAIEEDGRDDPDVFDMAKDYVFQAMERDAFPGFLNLSRPLFRIFRRSDVLGSLVNRLSGVSPGPEVVQSLYDGGHGMQRIPPQQLFEALGTGKPPQV